MDPRRVGQHRQVDDFGPEDGWVPVGPVTE